MLGGTERTVRALAVRQAGPVGQWSLRLANQLQVRLAETDGEPHFRSVTELESVFDRAAQVLVARHWRRSIVATGGKSHRNSSSERTGGLPSGRTKRIVAGPESRQT